MELYQTLILWAAGVMIVLLLVNLYIRMKVWKHYLVLSKNRVDIPVKQILNTKYLEEHIIPKYPTYADNIRAFSRHLQISLRIVSILLMLITLLAGVIYYFRE